VHIQSATFNTHSTRFKSKWIDDITLYFQGHLVIGIHLQTVLINYADKRFRYAPLPMMPCIATVCAAWRPIACFRHRLL
jgi:hypothetical protein